MASFVLLFTSTLTLKYIYLSNTSFFKHIILLANMILEKIFVSLLENITYISVTTIIYLRG